MKQLICILIACVAYSNTGFAQKDSKAKDILDKSQNTFSNSGGVSVNFTLNVKDIAVKLTESFDGIIQLNGSKFYLSTPDAETWFDGKIQWVHMKGSGEVNLSEPDKEEVQLINPAAIFGIYKKGCNYKYLGEKIDGKKRNVHEIELLPQGKSEMNKIILQVDKSSLFPVYFRIYYKNKIENTIYINKFQTQVNFSDKIFTFDSKKYPMLDIIDLR